MAARIRSPADDDEVCAAAALDFEPTCRPFTWEVIGKYMLGHNAFASRTRNPLEEPRAIRVDRSGKHVRTRTGQEMMKNVPPVVQRKIV